MSEIVNYLHALCNSCRKKSLCDRLRNMTGMRFGTCLNEPCRNTDAYAMVVELPYYQISVTHRGPCLECGKHAALPRRTEDGEQNGPRSPYPTPSPPTLLYAALLTHLSLLSLLSLPHRSTVYTYILHMILLHRSRPSVLQHSLQIHFISDG